MSDTSNTRFGITEDDLRLIRAATRLGDDFGLVTDLAELLEQRTKPCAWHQLCDGAICYVRSQNRNYSLRLIDCDISSPPFEKLRFDLPEDSEFVVNSQSSLATFTASDEKRYALNFRSEVRAKEFCEKVNMLQCGRRERTARNKNLFLHLMEANKVSSNIKPKAGKSSNKISKMDNTGPSNLNRLHPSLQSSAPPQQNASPQQKAQLGPPRGLSSPEGHATVSGLENTLDGQIALAMEMGYEYSDIAEAFESVSHDRDRGPFSTVDEMIDKLSLVQEARLLPPSDDLNAATTISPSASEKRNADSGEVRRLVKRMEEIKKELNDARLKLKEVPTCVVCLCERPAVVFRPCSHLVCCGTCGTGVDTCPICRQEISAKIKVFQ